MSRLQPIEKLDPFDSAFVDALLLLRGVDEPPTLDEFTAALATLNRFYSSLMKAPLAREAEDVEVTGDTLFLQAMRYACLYERFGLVSFSQATREQLATVSDWVSSGELPQS